MSDKKIKVSLSQLEDALEERQVRDRRKEKLSVPKDADRRKNDRRTTKK